MRAGLRLAVISYERDFGVRLEVDFQVWGVVVSPESFLQSFD